jgi:hypothetical protein
MRFMVLVKADDRSESGAMPDEKILADMATFNEEAVKSGTMLGGDGLQASAKGARVRYDNGKITVTDGPFTEAKELVAGYWIIRAGSLQEAIDWARRAPFQEGEVEIRQLQEIEDFPVDPSEKEGGWRDKETQARQSAGAWPKFEAKPGKLRFIGFVKGDTDTEAGVPPSPELLEAMGQLMGEAMKSGKIVGGEGLAPSAKGARIRYSGTKRMVVDGPFTEAKELVAGFALMLVDSKAEAIELGKQFVRVDGPHRLGKISNLEIRQLMELSDFVPSEAVDRHAKLRQEMEKR